MRASQSWTHRIGPTAVVAFLVVTSIAGGCSRGKDHGGASPPGPDGTESFANIVDRAYASEDPRGELAVSLEESGFEDETSGCIAEAMVDDLDRDSAVAGAAALEEGFLFDDDGKPVDERAWRILRKVNTCTTEEIAARLTDRGLTVEAARCIAESARGDDAIAVALALYSASLVGPDGDRATELADRLLDSEPAAPTSDTSTAALLVARARDCVSPGSAAEFLDGPVDDQGE